MRNRLPLRAGLEREQIKADQLRRVRLCGSHGNFRARPSVNHIVRLARNRRADAVCDGDDFRACLFRKAQSRERVGGFSRLAYDDEKVVRVHDWISVAVFGRDVNFGGKTREFFESVFRHLPRVRSRSAGGDDDSSDVFPIDVFLELFEFYVGRLFACLYETRPHCVQKSLWLLVNFFQHEMRVSFFFRR